MQESILINILTRTSNRPLGMLNCYNSIKKQTYKNIRHIVAYDTPADLEHLNDLDVDLLQVEIPNIDDVNKNQTHLLAPYNLYCNQLLAEVEEGWILFLDDDDSLRHNRVIEEVVKEINKNPNNDRLFIWQMRYPDGRLLPSTSLINNGTIKKYNIGSPCFMFHSKYKSASKWDFFKASDYRFLKGLTSSIKKTVFLNRVNIQLNNFGDLGKRNDIAFSQLLQKSLYFKRNLFWYLLPKYHFKLFGKLIFHKNSYFKYFKR